jgi:hypothetical protein
MSERLGFPHPAVSRRETEKRIGVSVIDAKYRP